MTTSNGVNNEIDSIIPEEGAKSRPKSQPSPPKKPVAKKIVKPAKPLVEGINSPRSTQDVILVKSNLSQKEKELVSEIPETPEMPKMPKTPEVSETFDTNRSLNEPGPRLMPESVVASINKKDHHIGRWLLIFVVLLILVAGAYEFYGWKLNRGQEPVVGHYHPAAFDAAQPFPLAGESPSILPTSTPDVVASTTPTSAPAVILQIKINSTPTGTLNVRSTPSSSGNVLTQVKPGEIYTYTAVQNNWYEITYSGFEQGWVSGQYVTKQ